jgi:hypothetical protein
LQALGVGVAPCGEGLVGEIRGHVSVPESLLVLLTSAGSPGESGRGT